MTMFLYALIGTPMGFDYCIGGKDADDILSKLPINALLDLDTSKISLPTDTSLWCIKRCVVENKVYNCYARYISAFDRSGSKRSGSFYGSAVVTERIQTPSILRQSLEDLAEIAKQSSIIEGRFITNLQNIKITNNTPASINTLFKEGNIIEQPPFHTETIFIQASDAQQVAELWEHILMNQLYDAYREIYISSDWEVAKTIQRHQKITQIANPIDSQPTSQTVTLTLDELKEIKNEAYQQGVKSQKRLIEWAKKEGYKQGVADTQNKIPQDKELKPTPEIKFLNQSTDRIKRKKETKKLNKGTDFQEALASDIPTSFERTEQVTTENTQESEAQQENTVQNTEKSPKNDQKELKKAYKKRFILALLVVFWLYLVMIVWYLGLFFKSSTISTDNESSDNTSVKKMEDKSIYLEEEVGVTFTWKYDQTLTHKIAEIFNNPNGLMYGNPQVTKHIFRVGEETGFPIDWTKPLPNTTKIYVKVKRKHLKNPKRTEYE